MKSWFHFIFVRSHSCRLPPFSGDCALRIRLHDAVVAVHHVVGRGMVLVTSSLFLAGLAAMSGVGTQPMCPTVEHLHEVVPRDDVGIVGRHGLGRVAALALLVVAAGLDGVAEAWYPACLAVSTRMRSSL